MNAKRRGDGRQTATREGRMVRERKRSGETKKGVKK